MVWIGSRYFGVGKATSKTGKIFVVAYYFPPGNQPCTFHENVLPPVMDQDNAPQQQSSSDHDNNTMPLKAGSTGGGNN